jgi:hypothetical protein
LWEVATEISHRLINIFGRDERGRRAAYGGTEKFQADPHWRDLILFNEYFHGDNGAGLGASHQTGWTGLIAKLIQQCGEHCRHHGAAPTVLKEAMRDAEYTPTETSGVV